MSAAPRVRVTTAPRPEWAGLVRKALDPAKLTVTSVLTFPEHDLEGDWVDPAGGTWGDRLTVDIDHDPARVVGAGSVVMKAVAVKGRDWELPHGTTRFRDDALGHQAFKLVEQGVMTGVSMEFAPVVKKAIGPSLLRGPRGTAYRYDRWELFGWCHCLDNPPINAGARSLPDSVGKALAILDAGRLGGAPLDPAVRKALSAYRDYPRPATATVPRSLKAMDTDTMAPPMAPPTDPAPVDAAPPVDDGTPPEASEASDGAQMLTDLAETYRQRAAKTLHPPSRKQFAKWADKLDAMAAEKVAHAESVQAEVAGNAPDAGDDADDTDTYDAPADDPPEPTDDEKLEKAFGTRDPRLVAKALRARKVNGLIVLKSGYVARRRWTPADVRDVPTAPTPDPVAAKVAAIRRRAAARAD